MTYSTISNSSKVAIYDGANRTLRWQNLSAYAGKKVEDDIKLTVSAPDAVAGLVLTPSVTGPSTNCCDVTPTQLLVGKDSTAKEIDSSGGSKQLTSRIKLEFGPGAVKQKTNVKATEYVDSSDLTSFLPFDLGPDISFESSVTATIDLSGVIPADLLERGFVPTLFYAKPSIITETVATIDRKNKDKPRKRLVLENIPSYFDPYKQTVTARLEHFSSYEFGSVLRVGQPEPWKLNPSFGNVGLFRGSMNYNFRLPDIKLPDGLGADLALNYSSAAADEGGMDATRTGKGWSMDVPSVRRGVKVSYDQYHNGSVFNSTWYLLTVA